MILKNHNKEIHEQMDEFEEETQRLLEEALEEIKEADEKGEEENETDGNDNSEESTETTEEGESKEDGTNAESEESTNDDKTDDEDDTDLGDSKSETETETQDFEPITVKSGDIDIVIKSREDLIAYAQKGADSLKNKDNTRQNDIIEQGGLDEEKQILMIDAMNGDKAAVAKILELAKVDPFDIDAEDSAKYEAKFAPTVVSDLDKVANEIVADNDHFEQYKRVTSNIPKDFVDKIQSEPVLLKNFSDHIKSGLAMEIIPEAITRQMRDGGNFFEAYSKIGLEKMNANKNTEETKETEKQTREVSDREKSMRQKITNQKETTHKETKSETAKEIWQMTDEEFKAEFGE